MNSIRKSLIKSILFVLIFFVLLFSVSCLLRPTITTEENNEKRNLLGYYAEPENSIDLLYFGSSDATVYWMPYKAYKEAGITSYTYGKSMMRAGMFEDLLDEALKHQSPSLTVISMRTLIESGDTLEEAALRSVTDSLPYTSANRWRMIWRNRNNIVLTGNEIENGGTGEPESGMLSLVPFYFDIIKYHDNWQDIWKDSFNFGKIGSFRSDTKGFLIRTGHQRQTRDASVPSITEKQPLSETAEKALRGLMQTARGKGLELLFVMSPYCETAEDRMLYNEAARIISEEGFSSVDFNEYYGEIGLDEQTDFYDPRHINTLGAEKYTAFFVRWIGEHYGLPDRRGDERYAAWDKDLADWESIEADALKKCRQALNPDRVIISENIH